VLKEILKSKVEKDFAFRSVSKTVNQVANNSPDLIETGSSGNADRTGFE
jgi:hypothetical protein